VGDRRNPANYARLTSHKFAETSKTELRVAVIGEIAETFP